MATRAATPMPEPRKRNLVEVKAPEQFQFSKQGQEIQGHLISIEPISIKGKQGIEYMFKLPNDRGRLTCLGTADLNKKMDAQYMGCWHQIRYETDDSSFQKEGQSPMKVFKVQVDSGDKLPGF